MCDTPAPTVVMVPGWQGSGLGHWQTLWMRHFPGARRVTQSDWESPERAKWTEALLRQVMHAPSPVVLAAHSLGCLVSVHLPDEALGRIVGALLVAPADPGRRAVFRDFARVPYRRLPFHSVVVASSNDPYCPSRLADAYARAWGSEFIRLNNAGHINVDSGHGEWPFGLALLQSIASVPRTTSISTLQTA